MFLLLLQYQIWEWLFYLSDPQDGVSINVKVWRVGDAEQDLQTERNPSDVLHRSRDKRVRGHSSDCQQSSAVCYLHDLHLQVLMQGGGDPDGLQHLAEQLLFQNLHLRADSAHKPVVTQELLMRDEVRVHRLGGTREAEGRIMIMFSTCMPASAVWPSLVFLDSRAICSGSRQRSLLRATENRDVTDLKY